MLDLLEPVAVEPDATAARIRQFARENPDLRDDYDGPDGTVYGLCYPLAEAYFHATGGLESGLEVYCLSWSDVDPDYDGTHWYLRDGRRWLDLGIERPLDGASIPYHEGRGPRAFITGFETPSKRAQRILEGCNLEW